MLELHVETCNRFRWGFVVNRYLRVGRYWEGVQVSIMAVKRDYADSMSCLKPYATEHNIDMLLWHAR